VSPVLFIQTISGWGPQRTILEISADLFPDEVRQSGTDASRVANPVFPHKDLQVFFRQQSESLLLQILGESLFDRLSGSLASAEVFHRQESQQGLPGDRWFDPVFRGPGADDGVAFGIAGNDPDSVFPGFAGFPCPGLVRPHMFGNDDVVFNALEFVARFTDTPCAAGRPSNEGP
jgi:hypothetical protein